ncbi:MAG: hypothetical protein CL396_06065 [Acidiferrobacteraceae bacterium]|nr:hypothetical protein [Acidiferrobacteraceae bacterium]
MSFSQTGEVNASHLMNGRTERLLFLPDGFMQVMDIGFKCREERGALAQGEIFDCLQWLH